MKKPPCEGTNHPTIHADWDDPDHPIPSLSLCDVLAYKPDGGATLTVVIASPLQADAYSQRRLLDKLERYLGFIGSSEFQGKAGTPAPENTDIQVAIHPESDPLVFELLERCRSWVAKFGVRLDIRTDVGNLVN
jgi:hypothetical protein